MNDPYVLASGVLRNKLGITDGHTLARVEADITRQRIAETYCNSIPGNLDFEHLCAIHKHIFGDVYAWAGEPRTVDIAKDDSRFAHWAYLDDNAREIFARLKPLHEAIGNDRSAMLDVATSAFSELNALHAFREGNGRALRCFLDHLGRNHGFDFAWERLRRDQVIGVSIFSIAGNDAPLRSLLDAALSSTERTLEPHHEQMLATGRAAASNYLELEASGPALDSAIAANAEVLTTLTEPYRGERSL